MAGYVGQETLVHFVFLNSGEEMGTTDIPLEVTLQKNNHPIQGE